jgi:hypothetical protein
LKRKPQINKAFQRITPPLTRGRFLFMVVKWYMETARRVFENRNIHQIINDSTGLSRNWVWWHPMSKNEARRKSRGGKGG